MTRRNAKADAVARVRERLYPECHAGGFSRVDGSVAFFARVRALASPGMTVLDYGAGRGRWLIDDQVAFRRDLRMLKGYVTRVIGVDVDPAVQDNQSLDEAFTLGADGRLPLDDASVDLVIADWVFEHLEDPRGAGHEVARVMKPGAWLCARTPNRWGYIALGATLVPRRLHSAVLARVQPAREARDVFPAHYRLNTRGALRRAFPSTLFEHFVYGHDAEPAYFGSALWAWRAMMAFSRLAPEALASVLLAFLRKHPS